MNFTFLYRTFLKIPVLRRYSQHWYKCLGVKYLQGGGRLSNDCNIIGNHSNIILHAHSEINSGVFLLAKDTIEIGENSTLAYGVTILTSANPNSPWNKLADIYPKMTAPVRIGDNVWVGANAIILPGVNVGEMSVIAAGSVVTKDVPSGVLVAGNPATIKKKLT
ncbi:MAG: acyltransferase [Bacteroidales bacterium]|jgi:acetyltransferase-like isoleucine patch superfamily enzyme|nr:acyltransferase [Bacteroidales bacterium]MCI2136050.1 acyltransferase [Bacteroidales bacterium]